MLFTLQGGEIVLVSSSGQLNLGKLVWWRTSMLSMQPIMINLPSQRIILYVINISAKHSFRSTQDWESENVPKHDAVHLGPISHHRQPFLAELAGQSVHSRVQTQAYFSWRISNAPSLGFHSSHQPS